MKLQLRRDQKAGLLGKIAFTLDIRAQLSPEEQAHIKKYKLGDTILYQRDSPKDTGPVQYQSNVWKALGTFTRLMGAVFKYRVLNLTIQVKDLEDGKRIEVKDIMEMLAVEAQIKEAAHTFKQILDVSAHFGGEEIIEIS